MPLFARVRSSFRTLFAKDALEADLDEELSSHLEMLTDEMVRQGLDPVEARRQARLELGGAERVKEQVRGERVGATLDVLALDLRFTARAIRRNPGFSVVVTLILAIGIGATTALFSAVNGVLLHGAPFERAEELVVGLKTAEGRIAGPVSRPDYFDFRDRSRSFAQLACMGNFSHEELVVTFGRPELIDLGFSSWNLFATLGVRPVLGRSFLPRDEEVGGATVILISHRLWQSRYGGSPDVIGGAIDLDGAAYEIVGVLPQGFRFLFDVDVWLLIDRQGPVDLQRDSHSLVVVGRLAPGTSVEQAQAEVDGIAAALGREHPETNGSKGLWLGDLHGHLVRNLRSSLTLLMATTALVLLIACGNVAGLLLARGHRRLPELAMRSALGAPRGRLVRQLVTESLAVTLLAGSLGVGVAWALQRPLLRMLPMGELGIDSPRLDAGALLFAMLVSVASGLLVGVLPAIRSTSVAPACRLVAGPRVSEGVRSSRLRSGLVMAQVALSVLLLIGSALLARSLARLAAVDLGFDGDRLLTARLQVRPADHPTAEERNQLCASLLETIDAMPGVRSATAITKLPILNPWQDWPVWPAGQPRPLPSESRFAMARWAAPGYFQTLGIPLLAGRDISSADRLDSARVVVLSASVAGDLFPDRDPVGQEVGIGWDEEPWRVVGIVGEARLNRISSPPEGAMYMPLAQLAPAGLALAVKTSGDPMTLVEPIREAVRELDPNAMLSREATMTSVVGRELAGYRVTILSLGLFSALAMLLSATGLYGVLAYNVSQRAREMGVRMAFGAAPGTLVLAVVVRGLALVAGGAALGLVCAVPSIALIRGLLFEVEPWDPLSFAGALAMLAVIGLLACALPALRVTRLDPARVLRAE